MFLPRDSDSVAFLTRTADRGKERAWVLNKRVKPTYFLLEYEQKTVDSRLVLHGQPNAYASIPGRQQNA